MGAGAAFWAALADDDDERTPTPGPHAAQRIRARFGFSVEDCRHLGLFTKAIVLSPTAIRLSYPKAEETRFVPGGSQVEGCQIALALDKGRWLVVDPLQTDDRPGVAIVDLMPLLES